MQCSAWERRVAKGEIVRLTEEVGEIGEAGRMGVKAKMCGGWEQHPPSNQGANSVNRGRASHDVHAQLALFDFVCFQLVRSASSLAQRPSPHGLSAVCRVSSRKRLTRETLFG